MEFNYLVEKKRMFNILGRIEYVCSNADCNNCPLLAEKGRDGAVLYCEKFEMEYPIKATEIVRKWAEEHPKRTRKDVLLEKFPKAILDKNGQPCVCAQMLGLRDYDNICEDKEECLQCWNTEVEE